MDYAIEVTVVDGDGRRLEVGSEQYHNVISSLKNHLKVLKNAAIHENFKFIHARNATMLVFVGLTDRSTLNVVREHIHELNRYDEKTTIIFDGAALKIILK